MPIKPENKSRYPKNWKQIREKILERANNKCEWCGVENHSYRLNEKTGKKTRIVLTIAHMNEVIEDCSPGNLRALCQKCHLSYDAKMHAEHARQTREAKKGQTYFEFNEL